MLLHRIMTAIVAIPILILYIWKGGSFLFSVLICAVSFLSLSEFYNIVFNGEENLPATSKIPLFGYFTCLLIMIGAHIQSSFFIMGVLSLNLLAVGSLSVFHYEPESNVLDTVFKQIQGVVYVPLFLSSLIFIRNGENGVTWIFFILLLVAAGDTGAYFAGTYLGKNKLCPKVSPGKTVEGFIGALLTVVLIGIYFNYHLLPELSWLTGILLFLLIGVIGVIGDLFESVLKREGKIKDSGTILPGHGGMLDRIDGLIFVAPMVFYFKQIFIS